MQVKTVAEASLGPGCLHALQSAVHPELHLLKLQL